MTNDSNTAAARLALAEYEMEARRYRDGSTPEQCMGAALEAVRPHMQGEVLRQAAEAWGDGREGFPYVWLLERAAEIEDGHEPNWQAASWTETQTDIPFECRKHDSRCEGPDPLCRCLDRLQAHKQRQLDAMASSAVLAHHELCVYRKSNRVRPCSCAVSLEFDWWYKRD